MKTILTALNAKYAHSSLALRYLKAYNKMFDINIMEFTINDSIHSIYSALLSQNADMYCFSCYIWNVEQTIRVASMIKSARPDCKIVFGGPECSYNAEEFLKNNSFIDHIIVGEGEKTLTSLLQAPQSEKIIGSLYENLDLNTVTLPYDDEDLKALKGKIIYFETSRGCPYKCSYCLSAVENRLRYFPMEYVKKGFDLFFKNSVPLVKLIDRTFNANSKRAVEIISYILENSKNTCVHFEIAPQILTDEVISLLASAPKGMFQLEMGIQSANIQTLNAINRDCDLEKISENIKKIQKSKNMHIHLDLIAGLPFEDYSSFGKSFNYVYSLKPDMLQLGFLKVLHGAPIEKDNSIIYANFPPYEVISTKWVSAEEMCRLKDIEAAVEAFYNSGAFKRTVEYITSTDAFTTFEKLSIKLKAAGSKVRVKLYQLIYDVYGDEVLEPLVYDFLENNKNYALPEFVKRDNISKLKEKCYNTLRNDEFLSKYNIIADLKFLRFEPVLGKVIMVDYHNSKIYDVSEYFIL